MRARYPAAVVPLGNLCYSHDLEMEAKMTERRTTRVEVVNTCDAEIFNSGTTLASTIDYLNSVLNSIPDQFRAVAIIQVYSDTKHDCPYSTLQISYTRDETDEEMQRRIDDAYSYAAKMEHKERQLLAKLSEKYKAS